MARLYADENFPASVVSELRRLGHDVLTAQEAGNADQSVPDQMVLGFAAEENRCTVTMDRWDFIRLHKKQSNHAGIIVCSFDRDYAALALRIDSALTMATQLSGSLLRINRPQS